MTKNSIDPHAIKILITAHQYKGLVHKDSIFNEAIEKKWVGQWLFFANSTPYASAMAEIDYGIFVNGGWYMSKNIQGMVDWLEFKLKEK